jgi:hypothetical protein
VSAVYQVLLATATAAKAGSTVTALVNGAVTTVSVARDLTVASGDVIIVTKVSAQWFALGRGYTAAPTSPINQPGPPAQPTGVTGALVVSPVETRSYRNGAWRFDNTTVYQGQYGGAGNHTGAVFYGSAPRSLSGATVLSAVVQVRRESGGAYAAQATTMRLMTNSTRPAGTVTLTSTTAGPSLAVGRSTVFTIPTAWAQSIVDGTAGGLGFFDASGSPYVQFAGLGDWGPAFSLTINWQR